MTEVLAPWLFCRKKNPKLVIASLELLATLVAVKVWAEEPGGSAEVLTEAFRDNQGNSFALKNGMSSKYPLTVLLMELAEELALQDRRMVLTWVKRDDNQGADDLTNEVFTKFSGDLRVDRKEEDIKWRVLDGLLEASKALYEKLQRSKADKASAKRKGGFTKTAKRAKQKLQKW